ncbi:hypothetical protein HTIA_p2845 (plasmid) [Halorhabdus tiamatea SARL4B]|uniref:Uncharacterized protein n=1 Tax=Halorhabdus tiamatea SARL4B TaxID=1033806 RepID=S6CW22_9EURY|nr:hypothetical protein HTIA_p2845 [Halorhabdus tiamatea SARL4B]
MPQDGIQFVPALSFSFKIFESGLGTSRVCRPGKCTSFERTHDRAEQ